MLIAGAVGAGSAGSGSAHVGLFAQPGTVAFLVVFGMAVLLFFVFRSMSKHLRKVNQMARDEEQAAAAAAPDAEQDAQAGVSNVSDVSR